MKASTDEGRCVVEPFAKDLVTNVIELLLTELTTAPFSKDQERKDGKIFTCEVA
jgi:hypothetical protein